MLACRYGLGQLEYRQEKFEMAAFNFKRALDVRPRLFHLAVQMPALRPYDAVGVRCMHSDVML